MAVAFAPEHPVGPRAVRSVKLRVIGGAITLDDHVPATRAECPRARPCGHIRCEWHLWLVQGIDRPGRRHVNERPRLSELRPVNMDWPLPPSCGLDVIEQAMREGWSMSKMAGTLGVRLNGFRHLLNKAMRKLRESGVSLREFLDDAGPGRATLEPKKS
jgi:hypothetical protein